MPLAVWPIGCVQASYTNAISRTSRTKSITFTFSAIRKASNNSNTKNRLLKIYKLNSIYKSIYND